MVVIYGCNKIAGGILCVFVPEINTIYIKKKKWF
jgi:hypothetical protein